MRIGFDVTPLYVPHGGTATYAFNLLKYLQRQAEDEVFLLAHRRINSLPPLSVPTSRAYKILWMLAVLPWHLRPLRLDVGHFTNAIAPLWAPCPIVLTIHDITLWLFPNYHPRRRLLGMLPFVPLAARRAAAVVTPSQATKRDVVRIARVPGSKVHVIPHAPNPVFQPLPQSEVDRVRQRYRLPDRFVLHVGTLEPRKNLVRLLEALATLRRGGTSRHALVLVGDPGWDNAAVFAAIEQLDLRDIVFLLSELPTEDLAAVYNAADAVALPSLYEGFGFPLVEAMACGTPVVASTGGGLAEVADDAAETVEPTSVESISIGLRNVLTDKSRRDELRQKGLTRAADFTWERVAEQTRAVYAKVVQPLPRGV